VKQGKGGTTEHHTLFLTLASKSITLEETGSVTLCPYNTHFTLKNQYLREKAQLSYMERQQL